MFFFLVEEQSDGASKAWQVSQPVRACEPTAPAYFFVVKVMFVGVVNGAVKSLSWPMKTVVYFDQQTGASLVDRWPNSSFWCLTIFFITNGKKKRKPQKESVTKQVCNFFNSFLIIISAYDDQIFLKKIADLCSRFRATKLCLLCFVFKWQPAVVA